MLRKNQRLVYDWLNATRSRDSGESSTRWRPLSHSTSLHPKAFTIRFVLFESSSHSFSSFTHLSLLYFRFTMFARAGVLSLAFSCLATQAAGLDLDVNSQGKKWLASCKMIL